MANKILRLGKSLRDRAGGLKPRAAVRLGLSALIPFAVMGCTDSEGRATMLSNAEVTLTYQGHGVAILRDSRTTCEYITFRGGIINRADPHGRVTPNCPETGGKYGTIFPGDKTAGGSDGE
jgi:hypothetical protein